MSVIPASLPCPQVSLEEKTTLLRANLAGGEPEGGYDLPQPDDAEESAQRGVIKAQHVVSVAVGLGAGLGC